MLLGLLEPIGIALDVDELAAMDEPIDDGDDGSRVGEDLSPFSKRLVCGDEKGLVLVPARDDLKEQIGVAGVVGQISQLINLCDAPHKLIHVKYFVMLSLHEDPA